MSGLVRFPQGHGHCESENGKVKFADASQTSAYFRVVEQSTGLCIAVKSASVIRRKRTTQTQMV
eukprot:1145957-Amphidinium_carterae.2